MGTWTRMWDRTGRDLAHAVRRMRRNPGFAVAAVTVIALGVGMAAAVFAVVDASLLRPLPFPRAEALVYLADVQDGPGYPASLPEFRDWEREGADVVAAAVAFTPNPQTIQVGEFPEEVTGGLVAGDLAGVVDLEPVAGRFLTPEERTAQDWEGSPLLVDEDFWHGHMGADPAVLGRPVTVDGRPHVVVGVMPREARLLFDAPDIAFWRALPDLPMLSRGLHLLKVVGRLGDGIDVQAAIPRMEGMAAGLRESGVTQHGVAIRPLREVLLGDTRRIAMILAGAVALVLLVAGANLAHLLLGRARARAREFAVRGALGAGRERLLRQVVTETMLLGLLGGVAGVGVAAAMMRWVASAAESPTVAQQASATDVRVVAFALLTALALGLLFGWIPARDATGASPGAVLRRAGLGSFSTARNRLRRALIGVELAFSVVLLSGAGLLVRTVDKLVHEDVGFSADGVLTAAVGLPGSRYPTPEASVRFWDDLTTRVRALPGVQGAGLISQLPFTGDTNGGFDIVGREFPEGESPHAKKRFAGPGLFEALRIPVESGRTFLPSDRLGEPEVAVISEALAEQYWPGEDPVGRRIRFLWQTDGEQEIVGVVGDVRSDALSVAGGGTIYLSSNQIENRYMALVVRASVPPETLAEPVRRSVLAIDPQQPVSNVRTMRSIVRGSVSDRTTVMQLLGAFAVLALVLAALGVYAIATQTVLGRTREIGLRIAVGASPSEILRAVVGHELVPVLIGLAAGLAGAAYAGRFLSGMLYQVSPLDPTTLLVVIGVLLLATLLALTLPAVRTLRVDPVVALRSD